MKTKNSLLAYVRILQDLMHLHDYTIVVSQEVSSQDCWADVALADSMSLATIRFGKGFETLSKAEQRYYICHELLHVHFWVLHDALSILGQDADDYEQAEERLVDRFAQILAPHLPLRSK